MRLFLIIITVAFSFVNKDNRNTKSVNTPASAHTVGESFGGGVIFYIDNSGQHGLIAASSDQKKAKWYNGNFILTNASGILVGTGQENTIAIITAQGAGSYAASECHELELNGYKDWFLPSKDELNLMFRQKTKIGGFSSPYYWSSTENSALYAWAQNFNNGFQDYGNKNSAPSVRAVRAF
jgi:hypothetical protein